MRVHLCVRMRLLPRCAGGNLCECVSLYRHLLLVQASVWPVRAQACTEVSAMIRAFSLLALNT